MQMKAAEKLVQHTQNHVAICRPQSALSRDSSPSQTSPKQQSIANKQSCRPRGSAHSAEGKILAAFV